MAIASRQRVVRVNDATHNALRTLAAADGESMTDILDRAVERYRRDRLLDVANEAWAEVLADPVARAEVEREDAVIDAMMADGLEAEE